MPTRAPTGKRVAPGPSASTRPMTWCPGITGNFWGTSSLSITYRSMADAAVGDANQNLPVGGLRSGIVREHKRVRFDQNPVFDHPSFHDTSTPTPLTLT